MSFRFAIVFICSPFDRIVHYIGFHIVLDFSIYRSILLRSPFNLLLPEAPPRKENYWKEIKTKQNSHSPRKQNTYPSMYTKNDNKRAERFWHFGSTPMSFPFLSSYREFMIVGWRKIVRNLSCPVVPYSRYDPLYNRGPHHFPKDLALVLLCLIHLDLSSKFWNSLLWNPDESCASILSVSSRTWLWNGDSILIVFCACCNQFLFFFVKDEMSDS